MTVENQKCYYCGGKGFEEKRIRYIYSRKGNSLLVPDMGENITQRTPSFLSLRSWRLCVSYFPRSTSWSRDGKSSDSRPARYNITL